MATRPGGEIAETDERAAGAVARGGAARGVAGVREAAGTGGEGRGVGEGVVGGGAEGSEATTGRRCKIGPVSK